MATAGWLALPREFRGRSLPVSAITCGGRRLFAPNWYWVREVPPRANKSRSEPPARYRAAVICWASFTASYRFTMPPVRESVAKSTVFLVPGFSTRVW